MPNEKYTLEESIKLIKDRIDAITKSYNSYKEMFKLKCEQYDSAEAEKYHKWMHEEYCTLCELKYLYNTITGKGDYE